MKSSNRFFFVTLAGVSALLLFLLLSRNPVQADSIVAVDTVQVAANPTDYINKSIRLRGFVKPATLVRFTGQAMFQMEQDGEEIAVFFNGQTPLPDTFTDGAAVRAEGFLRSADGVFEASVIEAKCTSKYSVEGDASYGVEN